jgi:hypothetical protein
MLRTPPIQAFNTAALHTHHLLARRAMDQPRATQLTEETVQRMAGGCGPRVDGEEGGGWHGEFGTIGLGGVSMLIFGRREEDRNGGRSGKGVER